MQQIYYGYISLNATGSGAVPEWVMLIPIVNGQAQTRDFRGPYSISSPESVIAISMQQSHKKLPIDECHSIDLAAPMGQPAPARGWIIEMQSRPDGIWGRVEWTPKGRALLEEKAYMGISPVLFLNDEGGIIQIARASLVNQPNLVGMPALNAKKPNPQKGTTMDFMEKVRKTLALNAEADEAAVLKALNARLDGSGAATTHSADLGKIGAALGCDKDAAFDVILNAAQEKVKALNAAQEKTQDKTQETTKALQTDSAKAPEVAALQNEVAQISQNLARAKSEHFIDAAIAKGRVGVKPAREQLIALHMQDPDSISRIVTGLPVLNGTALIPAGAPAKAGALQLNSAQSAVASALGIAPGDFSKAAAKYEPAAPALEGV